MADTLQSLAGARWSNVDVITRQRTPIAAEQAVLDRYVFLPFARSGIAAALTEPFAWRKPVRATVEMTVPIHDDAGRDDAKMTMHVYGPADVTEIDRRQVIRSSPVGDAHNAEVDDLVLIEFDRPELPWLFTPTGPDGDRLVPWISLIVAEHGTIVPGQQRGATTVAQIRRDQLQPLGDVWAWAHAQVMGHKVPPPGTPTLDDRLAHENAPHNLSRLVCPRRLQPATSYVACVVPTFLAGSEVGRGLTPSSNVLLPAWGDAPDFAAGDPASMVELPVYYSWRFTTGEAGNFESLARRLQPKPAPPGVGRRRVDATQPFVGAVGADGLALTAASPGAQVVVEGPIVSIQDPADEPPGTWPTEAEQHWEPTVTAELTERLNRPDRQAHEPDPGPPQVGPPLYGSNHSRQPRVEDAVDLAAAQPPWFREMNLDPRRRIVGGLGTRVVQAEQEDLMASAWNQVIGVEAANQALRIAQLAKHVAASLHERHLGRLTEASVVSATERVHAKLLAAPDRTVWAEVDASALPPAVTTGAFRRLLRVRGPIAKAASTPAASLDALTVRDDHLTTDWVLRYADPDGITALGAAARARLSDAVIAVVAPGVDHDTLVRQWDDGLADVGPEQRLAPRVVERLQADPLDLGEALVTALLVRLARTMPTMDDIAASPEQATAGVARAEMVRTVVQLARQANMATAVVPMADARRLDLPVVDRRDERHAVIDLSGLDDWTAGVMDVARRSFEGLPFAELENGSERLRRRFIEHLRVDGEDLTHGVKAIASKVIVDDPFGDVDRARLDAPALDLVHKLDPNHTVPARIVARLTVGTGRFPGWLRPGWFDDLRIEPVMACPRFDHPMYEPLDRYDREWMIPGLKLIERPDMATLLRTNSAFVEAYMVGLNHEMGRELLWREYPTDQRGTYFRSFWTGEHELVADLHAAPWRTGGIGAHIRPELDGQIVFLVRGELIRRYPGVVAHAVRQAQDAGGVLTDNGIPLFETSDEDTPRKSLFHIVLPPNILLAGFQLTEADIRRPGETWWFTLSENPSEPRFGLDEAPEGPPPPPATTRDDLRWGDFGVALGGFLDATSHLGVHFVDRRGDDCRWGASSAEVAALLFQLPARAAFLGETMRTGSR